SIRIDDSRDVLFFRDIVDKVAKKGYRKLFFGVYTDHLGNVRLSYTDRDNSGTITQDEIVEENNYYPFGLQQKGYNTAITGRKHNYKYNNTELEEGLGLNWYEMPLRSYDPTIARWNRVDPVVHHSLSTYNAFDNNPIIFADPSGGNSSRLFHEYEAGRPARLISNHEARFLKHDFAFIGNLPMRHATGGADNNGGGNSSDNSGGVANPDSPIELDTVYINSTNRSEMPASLHAMDGQGGYTTSYKGGIDDYNAEYGTNYDEGDLGSWYYDNFYKKELSDLRGSIQAAQAEAAEYVSYILPTPAIVGGFATRGAMALGKIGKGLNIVGRKVVLKLAKPHPYLYKFSTKTLRYGHGQFDAGHRATTFLHKEIIMNGKVLFRKSDYSLIFNYTTKQGQKFSEIINPFTRRIFHQAPNHIKL
ncbi:RHS repeat domain-containing protein, partial [Aquimarina sediminis]|uniref:RHS repeat domain-containing protein n=1 Tax=Aquimarina sediminis TaxID=2070536 RepID=UPI00293709EA